MLALIILLIVIFIGFISVASYNSLVRLQNLVAESWSGIDVQLKRRYDLIPNLVETVKGYSAHEKGLLESIAKFRSASMSASTVKEKSDAEKGLTQALKSLFAVVESYPDLKANQSFNMLHQELVSIENQIQLSRRYYNGVVRDYNTRISVFPRSIVASIFNFKLAQYFEPSSAAERENVKVQF